MIGNAPFFVVGVLFLMGLLGIFMTKNLIKIAIAVSILGSSVNIFLVALGYRTGGTIPVHFLAGEGSTMVMPTPQAMTLTAIVIALATTALLLSLIMLVWRHYGTIDVDEIRRLRG
ncbi:MAG: NADH-quinone oxidoreductase subunit K [Synergistaceae bacterium]|jgi:multicomponent Na+:H+ antiporter subunit C|uniref:sodium:proton antiporter n=1 Tax=Aminivibrio sp. TaxID=1872489 RepID=UPI0016A27386|nr:NADH-quinone oxidoreductase subunit K [Synergistaceae bacterium]MDD3688482.1 NADH-quinone oxidoreductase subunit K [Synergistaceae bacterium]MDD4020737.1 NADH-quinone oxidoreductase subunit K [Synergistaceae bacterium]MDD4611633.1 NADH-quinone oxidoreductase subunit K [Synergistaceae bacterium]NLO57358.1 cation:proton antiporter [Synergistaceae bacterium]